MRTIPVNERLIVALDVDTADAAAQLVAKLGDTVSFYKVGLQLFMSGLGPQVVSQLTSQGKKVFVDLKIDDTPRTVEAAVRTLATDGVVFFTLQGNGDTAKAAKAGRGDNEFPKFLQVTYLSSWDESDLKDVLNIADKSAKVDFDAAVIQRTRRILNSGCDGVIASGSSVAKLREAYPNIVIVTPGIRPAGSKTDDHKRVLTPHDAIVSGADHIVLGRPIRNSSDPRGTARRIQEDIESALREKRQGTIERGGLRFAAA